MKVGGIVLAGAIVGIGAIGCSSSSASNDPFGGAPDFASIQQQFKSPTGTFAGQESVALAGYSDQQSNSGAALSGFSLGAGGGDTSAQAYMGYRLHSLGVHPESGASCNIGANGGGETGSCNCPGGGTIQYDISGLKQYSEVAQKGGKVDATVRLSAQGCKSADGQDSIDGKIFENFRGTVPAAGTQQDPKTQDFAIIVDAHLTAVTKGKSIKADITFEFAAINGVYSEWFLVKVSDGSVAVSGSWNSTTKTGQITVTDKNGTTTCTATDGKTAVCTGPGGEKHTINL